MFFAPPQHHFGAPKPANQRRPPPHPPLITSRETSKRFKRFPSQTCEDWSLNLNQKPFQSKARVKARSSKRWWMFECFKRACVNAQQQSWSPSNPSIDSNASIHGPSPKCRKGLVILELNSSNCSCSCCFAAGSNSLANFMEKVMALAISPRSLHLVQSLLKNQTYRKTTFCTKHFVSQIDRKHLVINFRFRLWQAFSTEMARFG